MDPITMMLMQMAQGSQQQPSAPGADTIGDVNPLGGIKGSMGDLSKVMGGIKAPEATKPVFSGGVSGTSLPFMQQMPNILAPAMNASMQRIASQPQLPSLGQLLAGGR